MPQPGRELRPTDAQPAEKAWVYSLEEIIALQKALENGISELVANSPELLDSPGKTCRRSPNAEAVSAQSNAGSGGAVQSRRADRLRWRPGTLFAWIKRKLTSPHRSVQRGA